MRTLICFFLTLCFGTAFSQGLYEVGQITTIEITFPDNNWHQTLNNLQTAGNGERLLATVEINGTSFDSVGVRYSGGGTFSTANAKNPLNIKLDHVKNHDYQGYEVLKLANGAKDPSWLREVLGFEIARNFMEAPRANYASVYVNGNFLGLYASVESINSKFVSDRFFSNADNARFEANPSYDLGEEPVPPFGCTTGNGAALEYLGPGDACYFAHYELQSPTGWSELRALTELIKNNPNNLRSLADSDRFIWMSAFNNLLASLDSYLGANSTNYYVLKMDNGRWAPIVDDLNESFGRAPWLTVPTLGEPQPPIGFYSNLPLFQGENDPQKPLLSALFSNQTTKNMYVAHIRTMINQLFLSGWFDDRAAALRALVNDEVMSDDNHFYTHAQFLANLDQTVVDSYDGEDAYGLTALMDARIAYLLAQPALQAAPPGIANVSANPAAPAPNSNVTITAAIGNATKAWLGYRNNRKEVFQLTEMFDDGNHGDGAAGDGTYGASVQVQVGGLQYYVYAENAGAGMFSPERAEFQFYELAAVGTIAINELMASNLTSISDQDGEFEDWVELFNGSPNAINLTGWYLSDDPQELNKYQFPNGVVIQPNAYLTVWCDDDVNQPGLHTNFRLSASGESLILTRPDLTIADQVVFGPQTTDVSYGRCPNGSGPFAFLSAHSFGASNNPACATSADEAAAKIGLKVFPNPIGTGQSLLIQTNLLREMQGVLWSPLGQPVRSFRFAGQTTLELEGVPSGVYVLMLEGGVVERVVVVR